MSTQPIAKEIKQTSGYKDIADLKKAMPADPDATETATGKKERAKRGTGTPRVPRTPAAPPDPFINDPRYQAACARMAVFGGKGMIERGFDAGAHYLDDPKFKLNEKEDQIWDDFFYVLSKKPLFDVGRPIFLALFFFVTLAAQLGWRVVERTESDFLTNLFNPKKKETEGESQQ